MSRIRSFRYVSVEPTEHHTKCESCLRAVEDEVMYLMLVRRAVDYGERDQLSPSWFMACLRCYTEIESKATSDNPGVPAAIRAIGAHKQADGHPLYVAHSGTWNEDADIWNEVDEEVEVPDAR